MLFYIGFDRFYTSSTFIIETYTTIADQSCTMQKVIDHYRLIYIQFKMAITAANTDSNIIAHYLCGYHGQRFTLSGIYFSRHDRRTGFIVRNKQFSNTTSWSG